MNSSLEELFKNKFTDFRPELSESFWGQISTSMRKILIKNILTYTIISVVLLSSVTAIVLKNNNQNTTNILICKSSEFIINNTRNVKEQVIDIKQIKAILKQEKIVSNEKIIYVLADKNIETQKVSNKNFETDNNEILIKGFYLSEKEGCRPLKIVLTDEGNPKNTYWIINGKEYFNKGEIEISLENAGTYPIVLVKNQEGNKYIFSDSVIVYDNPKADFIVPQKVNINEQVIFENTSKNANSFQWYINDKLVSKTENLVYNFDEIQNARINLVVESTNNCFDTVKKEIKVEKIEEFIVFPNAFSPSIYGSTGGFYNLDSKYNNDVFRPYIFDKKVYTYDLKIYNKVGLLIFETNDLSRGWDGYVDNKLVPVDVYVYVSKGQFDDGTSFSKQGSVTVIYQRK